MAFASADELPFEVSQRPVNKELSVVLSGIVRTPDDVVPPPFCEEIAL
jgi:hypothetical protein